MNLSRHAWVVSVALAACAAPTAAQWEKPGASPAAAQEATEQCRRDAHLAALPPHITSAPTPSTTARVVSREEANRLQEAEQFQKCMRAAGYSPKRP